MPLTHVSVTSMFLLWKPVEILPFILMRTRSSFSRGTIPPLHARHRTHFQTEVELLKVAEVVCTPLGYLTAQNMSLTNTICYMS